MQRAKELEHDLEEELSEQAKDSLKKQVEEFDSRWEDISKKMFEAVQIEESPVIS